MILVFYYHENFRAFPCFASRQKLSRGLENYRHVIREVVSGN